MSSWKHIFLLAFAFAAATYFGSAYKEDNYKDSNELFEDDNERAYKEDNYEDFNNWIEDDNERDATADGANEDQELQNPRPWGRRRRRRRRWRRRWG